MAVDLTIPEIGESITEAFVGKWLKKAGDHVEKDQIVAELESEKANFELPAPVTGTIDEILVEEGDSAKVGDVIARMTEGGAKEEAETPDKDDTGGSSRSASAHKQADTSTKKDAANRQPAEKANGDKKDGDDSPSPDKDDSGKAPAKSRKPSDPSADDSATDDSTADGATDEGAADNSTADDSAARPATTQSADTSRREERVVSMSPMRQTIARHLVAAQRNAALLTTFNEIDMSEVIALRKAYRDRFVEVYGVKLGFMSFFVKACVDALKQYPAVNASVRGEKKIVYHNYYDIGIAVSTESGLVVPVVRDADQLSFADIEATIADFAQRASEHHLDIDELRGGTFTITNGGIFGSLLSTPIVNPPQSGVLGTHAIQDRPVAVDGQIAIRPMMYVALTYDHRIVDGREAVSFLNRIRQAVEQPARMLIEA
jgi:2-oxoglutarate dehydrogenase E2 component (dihydrolipoamide succinyltransferase)